MNSTTVNLISIVQVQGDKLNMAVFFWYHGKMTYTGQATFYKVSEKHSHVIIKCLDLVLSAWVRSLSQLLRV